jgi:PEP-CTERM motif
MFKRWLAPSLTALMIVVAAPIAARASTLGLDISAAQPFTVGIFNNIGWEFDVTGTLVVDGLGVFDFGANGLSESHQVGIWNNVGTLIVSTTVTGASTLVASADPDGDWRFASVAPTLLGPGRYVIGAFYGDGSADEVAANATILAIPGIGFVASRATNAAAFGEPGAYGLVEPGVFGPTLSVSSVPEPATLLFVGSGLVAGARRLRRRK